MSDDSHLDSSSKVACPTHRMFNICHNQTWGQLQFKVIYYYYYYTKKIYITITITVTVETKVIYYYYVLLLTFYITITITLVH